MHKLLQRALRDGRTGVSWLIYADSEPRVRKEADRYLMSLFCKEGSACGTCPGCQKYLSRSHVDLLAPEGNKVEDVHGLAAFAARHPFESNVKVIYISRVDELTEQAQNAILKIVEEPPKDTVIVLGAVNTEAVLPTILSRCTALEASADTENAVERVREAAGIEPGQAAMLVRAAGGDYDAAMDLFENGFLGVRKDAAAAMHRLLGAKNRATSQIEKLLWGDRERLEMPLRASLLYLADVLSAKFGGPEEEYIYEDMAQQISGDAKASARAVTASLTRLHELAEKMRACKGLNKKLALQGTLLGILEDIV